MTKLLGPEDGRRRSRVRRVRQFLAQRLDPPPPAVPVDRQQVQALRRAVRRLRSGRATPEERRATAQLRRVPIVESQLEAFERAAERLRNGKATRAERAAIRRLGRLLDAVGHRGAAYTDDETRHGELSLTELAQQFKTDKWGVHRYTPHYERHLTRFRSRPITLLEIGVGGYDRDHEGGASLRMWKYFLPRATIVGLDIEDKSFVDEDRITTVIGSQTDSEVLHAIVDRFGPPHVVVDDGSHVPADVVKTFHVLFPLLPPGAVYAIEDIQTSYWPEWGGAEDPSAEGTSMSFVKKLVDGLNHEEFVLDNYSATYTDQHVVAVHAYHNLVIIEKGDNREGTNKFRVLSTRYPQGSGGD